MSSTYYKKETSMYRTALKEDSDFKVYIDQTSSSDEASWRYEIYNALDNPRDNYYYGYGYGRSKEECELRAKQEIKKMLKPFRKHELPNFIKRFSIR